MTDVKRRYDSTKRQQQAQRNRDAVLDTARRLFLSDGYAGTTIAAIAGEAGVSVETIYKSFGTKAGLVSAIWQRGLAGSGPVPAPARSDTLQASLTSPAELVRAWGTLTTEVMPLVAPILLLIRAAASTDPEMATLLAETDHQRLQRMRHNARALKGHLRPGLTLNAAADLLWVYSSPDLYDLLVLRANWSMDRYRRHLVSGMTGSLLRDESA